LAFFTRRRFAPDGKVRRMALAFDRFDPALTLIGLRAGECTVIGDG
jgi:hypothetical protein